MDTVAVCCTLPLSVNDVALHILPTHTPPQAQTTSHTTLCTRPLSCCDVYDDVRCDPSDGAGAGVTHDTREVRGARSLAVGEICPPCRDGLGWLGRESERASVVPTADSRVRAGRRT